MAAKHTNLPSGAKHIKRTKSLCPNCMEEKKEKILLDADVYEKGGKVWMAKTCPEHGFFKELYWSDYDFWKRASKFQDKGVQILNPFIDKDKPGCPYDCGLCNKHQSHTALGNIVVTNRCDLSCWYCFFFAKQGSPVYEPSREQIRQMLAAMHNVKPVGANAVQLTGGEPCLRPDILDIIKIAREEGYEHVQLNTNGIRFSRDLNFVKAVRAAGSNVAYMSFDGVTPQTNPKNWWEAIRAVKNCREAGLGIVLVPAVIGGVNDHELGDILRFGFGNNEVIRGINFQPVSLVGRMPDKMRREQRVTVPGVAKRIETQTGGQIGKEDWFAIPCVKPITDFVELLTEKPKYRLSTHFACGAATYVFNDHGKMIPLPRFFDVEGFFEYLENAAQELRGAAGIMKKPKKTWTILKLVLNIKKFLDEDKKPKDLDFLGLLKSAVAGGDYRGLAGLHHSSLFLGIMHFQDPYNWDIDRVKKCAIHYATPDGKIIPFCTFNVIPELYRDKIQAEYSIPAAEWERKNKHKAADDIYKRSFTPAQVAATKKEYDQYRLKTSKSVPEWGNEKFN